MSTGKIMASMIVLSALLTGLAVYYLQVYGFYKPLDEVAGAAEIHMVADDMAPIPLAVTEFRGIDADSFSSCSVRAVSADIFWPS